LGNRESGQFCGGGRPVGDSGGRCVKRGPVVIVRTVVLVVVAYGGAAVEDVALAFPGAGCFGGLFEVFEDAALEVVDLGKAFPEEEGGDLLAADATGAKHGDLAVGGGVEVLADVGDEVGESVELGDGGAGEGADFGFVGVAGVEEEDFGVSGEGVPLERGT